MKYTKKSVTIEAFQYDGDLKDCNGIYYVPNWFVDAFEKGVAYYGSLHEEEPPVELFINTLEGVHHASVGDYIIKGVHGEFYPCKPDIFEETYTPDKTADEMFRELGYRKSEGNRYVKVESYPVRSIVIRDDGVSFAYSGSDRDAFMPSEICAVCKLLDEMGWSEK